MELPFDCDVLAVDDRFLGWHGLPMPPPGPRYRSILLGAAIGVAAFVAIAALGVGTLPDRVTVWLAVTLGSTWWTMKRVSYDVPLRSVIFTFVHEVSGPRRATAWKSGRTAARVRTVA